MIIIFVILLKLCRHNQLSVCTISVDVLQCHCPLNRAIIFVIEIFYDFVLITLLFVYVMLQVFADCNVSNMLCPNNNLQMALCFLYQQSSFIGFSLPAKQHA
uniref:Uncharacterized protein n=1 Tax=Glossina austeni TaxID=7395 RepID=A0A1A9VI32_GLOAU